MGEFLPTTLLFRAVTHSHRFGHMDIETHKGLHLTGREGFGLLNMVPKAVTK